MYKNVAVIEYLKEIILHFKCEKICDGLFHIFV